MNRTRKIQIGIGVSAVAMLGVFGLTSIPALASKVQLGYSQTEIATAIRWVRTGGRCNLCDGYYSYPADLDKTHTPLPYEKLPTHISSEGPTTFRSHGVSILRQHVVITQPGKIVDADKAEIYRNAKTGKITRIKLFGHVTLAEYGKIIHAPFAEFDLVTGQFWFHRAIYHVDESSVAELNHNSQMKYNAWGVAKKIYRETKHLLYLWDATYSTCSPLNPAWEIHANRMTLNKNTGRGTAYGATVYLHHVPIFYSPIYSFPLDNRRKSGFLAPTYGYSSHNGYVVDVPFYWNMAPNYDMLITPRIMSGRGVLFQTTFRYLTHSSDGYIIADVDPYDNEFARFRRDTIAQNQNNPAFAPFESDLKNDSNTRGYFSWHNTTQIGNRLTTNIILNYVTDDYFFNDFGTNYTSVSANQLLNQFSATFQSSHWTVTGMLQAFQTLHLWDLDSGLAQYARLPEFDATGNYPNLIGGLTFSMSGQAVNFAYSSVFYPLTYQRPVGQRIHLRPTLSRPFTFASGYITPSVALDNTDYYVDLAAPAQGEPRPHFEEDRTIPIADIDSGLFMSRDFHFHHHDYLQTFEPRLMYLYVPFENQAQFPIFDTQVLPFSYDQLFSLNRFSGFDRLENANQLSLGLESRVVDADSGQQLADFSLGLGYYFTEPQVTIPTNPLKPDQQINPFKGPFTPLVAQITLNPFSDLSVTGGVAINLNRPPKTINNSNWDFLNNLYATITYTPDGRHDLSVGYNYTQTFNGVPTQGFVTSRVSNLIHIGAAWPLTHKIGLVGYWYYNIDLGFPQSEFFGVQYSTCCWALRVLGTKVNLGTVVVNGHTQLRYNTGVMVQFLLKGIGTIGNADPNSLLLSDVPGFDDIFHNKHYG